MKLNFILILILFLFFHKSGFAFNTLKDFDNNCRHVKVTIKNATFANLGWPHRVGCDVFKYYVDYTVYFDPDLEFTKCLIWGENGTLLLNTSFSLHGDGGSVTLPDLQANSSKQFLLAVKGNSNSLCLLTKLNLSIQSNERSCEDFHTKDVFSLIKTELKRRRILVCKTLPKIFPKLATKDLTYSWYFNCNSLPLRFRTQYNSSKLVLRNFTFEDAGVYSCSVTYKNRTRFIAGYKLCIQKPLSHASKITMQCSNPLLPADEGDNATFNCTVIFGVGSFQTAEVTIEWGRIGSNEKNECYTDHNLSDRTTCAYSKINKCDEPLKKNQTHPNKSIANIQLIIRNVRFTDFGEYYFSVETNIEKPASNAINTTVVLQANQLFVLQRQIIAVVFIVVFTAALSVGVAALIRSPPLQLLLFIKKYCKGAVTSDKLYNTSLWYNFSNSLDRFSDNEIKIAIKSIRTILDESGYSVYDHRMEPNPGEGRGNIIQTTIKKSECIIVCLTKKFMDDDWNLMVVQQSIKEMVESGCHVVFVLFPGVKEFIDQRYTSNQSFFMIKRAIKISRFVVWSENTKLFKMMLEVALPKFSKPKIFSKTKNSHKLMLLSQTTSVCDDFSHSSSAL